MMRTVWKYEIKLSGDIEMPSGAKILCVAEQAGSICVWAEVDTDSPLETRSFRIYGTGHAMVANVDEQYVGTAFIGPYVWHVYEIIG